MRREYSAARKLGLQKFYPILYWRECFGCKMEFRREHGWTLKWYHFWACETCAPTEARAVELAEIFLKKRPLAPPPRVRPTPPPRRI